MAYYRVTLERLESATIDVEAQNFLAAKLTAIGKLENASCLADLDLNWAVDSDISATQAVEISEQRSLNDI